MALNAAERAQSAQWLACDTACLATCDWQMAAGSWQLVTGERHLAQRGALVFLPLDPGSGEYGGHLCWQPLSSDGSAAIFVRGSLRRFCRNAGERYSHAFA